MSVEYDILYIYSNMFIRLIAIPMSIENKLMAVMIMTIMYSSLSFSDRYCGNWRMHVPQMLHFKAQSFQSS